LKQGPGVTAATGLFDADGLKLSSACLFTQRQRRVCTDLKYEDANGRYERKSRRLRAQETGMKAGYHQGVRWIEN